MDREIEEDMIVVFETEGERVEYLANLLGQVDMTANQVLYAQGELSQVGFYND